MATDDFDIVELESESGEKITLRISRYFFYNGEEYVLLTDDVDLNDAEEAGQYIMKVVAVEGEEDMEEFVPLNDDALYEKLIQTVETVFDEDDAVLDDD